MNPLYLTPEFEVVRNESRCIACRVCERQCANEVHLFDETRGVFRVDESKCVNCQRCVSLCPTHALKIVKSDCRLRENANWQNDTIREIRLLDGGVSVLPNLLGMALPSATSWNMLRVTTRGCALPQESLEVRNSPDGTQLIMR